ncbi:hypothetical protein GGTG_05138 [Gaeumannomyces tritici R3-111a-1]|uniref:Uncharacterized protein n=1 Tax=Gaeumannomyces tritici (strain R3-111a-1) TaxID=644352 RepID=J3NV29_GAET3|nr:hypothetical protein GGTG_05138 [Gaeumannomyces tritici R3-111a-1]EJT75201.1 hypothetical protein GGTG_05138 [Gaeumannomyces tritici R3-111a-1]
MDLDSQKPRKKGKKPKFNAKSPKNFRVIKPRKLGKPLNKSIKKLIPKDITLLKKGLFKQKIRCLSLFL